jgi:hypothetical protein
MPLGGKVERKQFNSPLLIHVKSDGGYCAGLIVVVASGDGQLGRGRMVQARNRMPVFARGATNG